MLGNLAFAGYDTYVTLVYLEASLASEHVFAKDDVVGTITVSDLWLMGVLVADGMHDGLRQVGAEWEVSNDEMQQHGGVEIAIR